VLELLTADYTFVNERLARHYGIPGVSGPEFRKISYPDDKRRGVLGHGSILTLTSHGNRTSPVLRGSGCSRSCWALRHRRRRTTCRISRKPATRKTAGSDRWPNNWPCIGKLACSSCHNVIDPIGLALDNFDVTGSWRIKDRGVSVDPSGELYDGTPIKGAADLRAALVARSDIVISHFTEMLMSYALGRRVEHYDMPAIRRIVRDAKANDYRLSSLILGVARSAAFRTATAEQREQPEGKSKK
jgi:hypothetical protein